MKNGETSWIYCGSLEEFEKEGRRLWKKYFYPYLKDFYRDEALLREIEARGQENLLDPKEGMIVPGFPIELTMRLYAEEFNSSSGADWMKELLRYYACWKDRFPVNLPYNLQPAVLNNIIDPSNTSWCKQCGVCCTGTAGHLSLTQDDENRIVEFLKGFLEDAKDEEWCEDWIRKTTHFPDFLGEECLPLEGDPVFVFACPFLEKFDSQKNLCIIDPVKPEYCQKHDQSYCSIWDAA